MTPDALAAIVTAAVADALRDSQPQVLTVPQAAQHLGCSEDTVRRLITTGRLPAVDIGEGRKRQWRVGRQALVEFVEGRRAS